MSTLILGVIMNCFVALLCDYTLSPARGKKISEELTALKKKKWNAYNAIVLFAESNLKHDLFGRCLFSRCFLILPFRTYYEHAVSTEWKKDSSYCYKEIKPAFVRPPGSYVQPGKKTALQWR